MRFFARVGNVMGKILLTILYFLALVPTGGHFAFEWKRSSRNSSGLRGKVLLENSSPKGFL